MLLTGSDVNRIPRSNLQYSLPFLLNQTSSLLHEEQLHSRVMVPSGPPAGRKGDSIHSQSLILVRLQDNTGQDLSSEMVRINRFQGDLRVKSHRFLVDPLLDVLTDHCINSDSKS